LPIDFKEKQKISRMRKAQKLCYIFFTFLKCKKMSKRQRGKRSGRKGKRKWRKECDTFEATLITEKKEEEEKQTLFFIDKTHPDYAPKISNAEKIKQNREKLLSFEKKLPIDFKEKQKISRMRKAQTEKKNAEKMAKRLQNTRKKSKHKKQKTTHDIWGDTSGGAVGGGGGEGSEWIEDSLQPNTSVKVPRSISNSKSMRPQIAAVEIVSEGCSYHPPHDAHQDSLGEAIADAIIKQEKENKMNNKHNNKMNNKSNNKLKVVKKDEINEITNEINKIEDQDEEEEKIHNPWSTKFSKTKRNRLKRKRLNEIKKWRKDKRKQRNRDWNIFSKTLTGIELDLIEHSEKIREKKKEEKGRRENKNEKIGKASIRAPREASPSHERTPSKFETGEYEIKFVFGKI